jgi:hypothetical protein
MGYEWNKYNQTHYDEANPPPKVVQGYKFNIFYPNLVDTSKTPTYKVERNRQKRRYVGGGGGTSAGEDETCIIRFTAGPPYLDVAFRIIDRDWDYSSRFNRGFKSSFDKVYFFGGFADILGDPASAFPIQEGLLSQVESVKMGRAKNAENTQIWSAIWIAVVQASRVSEIDSFRHDRSVTKVIGISRRLIH